MCGIVVCYLLVSWAVVLIVHCPLSGLSAARPGLMLGVAVVGLGMECPLLVPSRLSCQVGVVRVVVSSVVEECVTKSNNYSDKYSDNSMQRVVFRQQGIPRSAPNTCDALFRQTCSDSFKLDEAFRSIACLFFGHDDMSFLSGGVC